jgi:hypothetical protein
MEAALGWSVWAAADRRCGSDAIRSMEPERGSPVIETAISAMEEETMTFGKGALLWLIGIPLPIIILLALFWR